MDETIEAKLLLGLEGDQPRAVSTDSRRVLIVASAGSGKTEIMARRVGWWLADGVPKESIVAFTFTERASEEMKFRIRRYVQAVTDEDGDPTLGRMYVGTIHGYCIQLLRALRPAVYHNYDVIDDVARMSLVQGAFDHILGLNGYRNQLSQGRPYPVPRTDTILQFLHAYDLLNEYCELDVELPDGNIPVTLGGEETEWCKEARLLTDVGRSPIADAFGRSAARFYAYMRCRRFLDFSTSQSELVRLLEADEHALSTVRATVTHLVVDEVQDVNVVQDRLIRLLVAEAGHLTAVGDHRQAIYGFRGSRVELMGRLAVELAAADDGEIVELTHNFRSTPRIIDLSNEWNGTIDVPASMPSPAMRHGRAARTDFDVSHTTALVFPSRDEEAEWIADTVTSLVHDGDGAKHDTAEGFRGLTMSDIAILVRSSTDARTYMRALRNRGVSSIVRAGPDLFGQPEVLLLLGALGLSASMDEFMGGQRNNSLPSRIRAVLRCDPRPPDVIRAAFSELRDEGLPVDDGADDALIRAARLIGQRMTEGRRLEKGEVRQVRTPKLRDFLTRGPEYLRRVFPQDLFHFMLSEAGVSSWDGGGGRGDTAMFHLGQLSTLITGIETRGWTSTREYPFQIHGLLLWGTKNARPEEAPLLAQPDAVQILTIHSAKGLEFACVFVADVCRQRFPSSHARRVDPLPFDGPLAGTIDAAALADNENYDDERRLMYVALTRAERYLFVTTSRPSQFFELPRSGSEHSGVKEFLAGLGGYVGASDESVPANVDLLRSEASRETRLVTSFSDLRYYLECPHDFYLRKVLGFAPTIDQAFGYGRGVHNLLREIHSDPRRWAELADDHDAVVSGLRQLVDHGLFYLRHTVGEPMENMHRKGVEIVADYVERYKDELAHLTFEPERAFETLIEEQQVLVSGAIDVIKLDDPPRVTIIDFKSGGPHVERMSLDEEEMALQVSIYGLAAKHELEYEPDRGLVRYLGAEGEAIRELEVSLDEAALAQTRKVVADAAREIRARHFRVGPIARMNSENGSRCHRCDFLGFCGLRSALEARSTIASS